MLALGTVAARLYRFYPDHMTFMLNETSEPEWWIKGHRVSSDEDKKIFDEEYAKAQEYIEKEIEKHKQAGL